MTDSARLALPLLEPGQAQKEWWHNEALALLDIAVQPVVEGIADTPPGAPAEGACWIVVPRRPALGRGTPARSRGGRRAAGAS